MIKLKRAIGFGGRIYLPRVARGKAFTDDVVIVPGSYAIVLHPDGIDLRNVVHSLKIIMRELEYEIANR